MLKNLKIGSKISLGFGIVILFTIVLSIVVFISSVTTNENLEHISEFTDFQLEMNSFMDVFDEARVYASIVKASTEADEQAYNRLIANFNESKQSISRLQIKARNEDMLSKFERDLENVLKSIEEWKGSVDTLQVMAVTLDTIRAEVAATGALLSDEASEIYKAQTENLKADIESGRDSAAMLRRGERLAHSTDIYLTVQTIRRSVVRMIDFYDMSGVPKSLELLDTLHKSLDKYIDESSQQKDRDFGINVKTGLDKYEELLKSFITVVNERAVKMTEAEMVAERTIDAVDTMLSDMNDALYKYIGESMSAGQTSQIVSVILSLLAVLAAFVIASVIVRSVTKPVHTLVNIVKDVSSGNLNINMNRQSISKDEIGLLTLDIYTLVDVLKNIIEDLKRMYQECQVKGDFEYTIDTKQYKGSFKDVTESVNNIQAGANKAIFAIFNAINEISNGNFNLKIDKFPGKQVVINEQIDLLTENLHNIHSEIITLSQHAASGVFTAANKEKYMGNWAQILDDLNAFVKAVAEPLDEIDYTVTEMAKGNFGHKITGNYKGKFDEVKQAVNSNEEITTSYINEITTILTAMSEGDLTVSINRDYIGSYAPIKQALATILNSLNKSMGEIESSAEQVLQGSVQISKSAQHLAEGSSRQASSVEELSASIETINEKTRINSGNAKNADGFSNETAEDANKSDEEMKVMVSFMEEIKQSSTNISKIIKTIEDIAFQTNLLALNAAVEAARAGEHGKGFAVVAEEVRTLAARSRNAAQETTALIEDSMRKVDNGMNAANETADSLEKIVADVKKVSELITMIADMSHEQAEAIAQINIGVSEISSVVQDNSATSEECAAASQELNSQAETLKQLVSFFKLK